MALGEVRLRDWFRVIRREIAAGLALGSILGAIGLMRILLWQGFFNTYGQHYLLVAMTVAFSLIGVVTFGTFAGSCCRSCSGGSDSIPPAPARPSWPRWST